ncbi:hypothetical protein AA0113_g8290 [Alternaria arborescens]|uniref:Uncharacterized protein n=1 Tax=Alternaria arborescens TaxID=156630 RepID=A0A4Q4RJK1_9PLEO|nr:hypothetical protein AA0112_g881 [Alternaria arborescens]RYO57023.1 hypothetical protein AA0113_g8290 [Alternaria arborescens]
MSQPNSKDNRARLPEAAHEDTPGIAGDQARSQAPPYAYDHGILTNYNLAASYTTVYGDSADRDWQDVALLFASTLLKVNALNEALHHASQARNAHAFALCDDFVRNFDKCLQDRILALARGETHDVPGHERLPGASMMRWASKNASKTKVESSTQTVEDDGSSHSIYEVTVHIPHPDNESPRRERSRIVPVESTGTETVPFNDDQFSTKQGI